MEPIRVETVVDVTLQKAWKTWTSPEGICNWNNASDDWYTPQVVNDVRVGGRFVFTMSSRDETTRFDFCGEYTEVIEEQKLGYTMDDGRKATVSFERIDGGVRIVEVFDPENINAVELQKEGWQAILNNFKRYVESVDN
jgi:uncharacterized protein YndB with AHSA1/START domain